MTQYQNIKSQNVISLMFRSLAKSFTYKTSDNSEKMSCRPEIWTRYYKISNRNCAIIKKMKKITKFDVKLSFVGSYCFAVSFILLVASIQNHAMEQLKFCSSYLKLSRNVLLISSKKDFLTRENARQT